jgi:hypothetical protein
MGAPALNCGMNEKGLHPGCCQLQHRPSARLSIRAQSGSFSPATACQAGAPQIPACSSHQLAAAASCSQQMQLLASCLHALARGAAWLTGLSRASLGPRHVPMLVQPPACGGMHKATAPVGGGLKSSQACTSAEQRPVCASSG